MSADPVADRTIAEDRSRAGRSGTSTAWPAVALAVWTLLVWTTRIRNIWEDDSLTVAGQVGRSALALSFTVLAVAVLAAVARRGRPARWLAPSVGALAGWTTAVWVVRGVSIALAGHDAGFVAVHLVLAVTSIALAALAWRSVRAVRPVSS